MHVLYRITYLPHINTPLPKFYIGSKFNYKGNYFGSVMSQTVPEYTGGLKLKDWWKTRNKQDFLFEIIEQFEEITPAELVIKERELQDKFNVLAEDYFNTSKAGKGFVSLPKTDDTKQKMSLSLRAFYKTEAGMKLATDQADARRGKARPDVSKRNSERNLSEFTKIKISNALKGKPKSEEWKLNVSNKLKGIIQPRGICTNCGTETTKANIAKHHNEKCKNKHE
jgi:hypothetical protein